MKRFYQTGGVAALSAALLLASTAVSRANLSYMVTLDTTALVGNANGPFSLDVALGSGSQTPNSDNTVTLSGFSFANGAAGAATYSSGGETGSMSGSVTLTNSATDNELAQSFSSGVTRISFLVNQTTNTNNPYPDQFTVAILDGGLNNIPTTDPSGANTLTLVNIATTETLGSVNTYQSSANGEAPGVTATVSAVPEPSSVASLLAGALGLACVVRRRSTQRATRA